MTVAEWELFEFPFPNRRGWTGRQFPAPVDGYCSVSEDTIGVGWVSSSDLRAFLRVLRQLEAEGKRVVFYTVINARLARLLQRRGYTWKPGVAYSERFGESIDGWVKEPRKVAPKAP